MQLGDVATVSAGGKLKFTKSKDYRSTGIPAYSAAGQDGFVATAEFSGDGVVLSSIGARCGKCFLAAGQWTTLANTQVILPIKDLCLARYLWYYANDEDYWARSGTAQPFIKPRDVRGAWLALPPLPEQQKIAEILGSVDEAIQATQAVIDQTRKVKQGLLQQLLTRGIGHTRFKQTEIGEIPESWEVVAGKHLFRLYGGYSPSAVEMQPTGDALFIKVNAFNDPVNATSIHVSDQHFSRAANPKVRTYGEGCLVFPKRGAAIFKNRVRSLTRPTAVDPNLMVLDPRGHIMPSYLQELLLFIGLFNLSDNSGVPQLNNKHLYPALFAVPPASEQQLITGTTLAIDSMIAKGVRENRYLARLKAGLMSDLLSGCVRVKVDA